MTVLFLDNNVLVGYIFEVDNWNKKSLKVMNCSFKKLSSDTVKNECYNIYNKNIRIIRREFQNVIAEINKTKSLKPEKILALVDTFYSKDTIIKYVNIMSKKDKRVVMRELRTLLADMESRCLKNRQDMNGLITFCTRNKSYNEIYQIFNTDGLAQIDPIDVEIIIDAHHIGLQIKNLVLITGDYKHVVPRKGMIKKNTSIKDVIGLGEFNLV